MELTECDSCNCMTKTLDNGIHSYCGKCKADKSPSEDWETKIRQDYRGIISDEQIEATVEYWRGIVSQAYKAGQQAQEKGQSEFIKELRKVHDKVLQPLEGV